MIVIVFIVAIIVVFIVILIVVAFVVMVNAVIMILSGSSSITCIQSVSSARRTRMGRDNKLIYIFIEGNKKANVSLFSIDSTNSRGSKLPEGLPNCPAAIAVRKRTFKPPG